MRRRRRTVRDRFRLGLLPPKNSNDQLVDRELLQPLDLLKVNVALDEVLPDAGEDKVALAGGEDGAARFEVVDLRVGEAGEKGVGAESARGGGGVGEIREVEGGVGGETGGGEGPREEVDYVLTGVDAAGGEVIEHGGREERVEREVRLEDDALLEVLAVEVGLVLLTEEEELCGRLLRRRRYGESLHLEKLRHGVVDNLALRVVLARDGRGLERDELRAHDDNEACSYRKGPARLPRCDEDANDTSAEELKGETLLVRLETFVENGDTVDEGFGEVRV